MPSIAGAGRLKRSLKRWLKRRQLQYVQRFRSFDTEDFVRCLRQVGLRAGDVVLVHTAYKGFAGFGGGPIGVIRALQSVLGPEGTLMMPTLPSRGSAAEYVRKHGPLDVRKTPSAMGLISEVFRRMPDVVRSIHPTHPVAAWGMQARLMTAEHQQAATPCGEHSPYLKLVDVDGKILFLGVGIDSMTFFHGVEEVLEPQMPFSPFTAERFDLKVRGPDGEERSVETRLYDSAIQRDPLRLVAHLKRRGAWSAQRVGTLGAVLLNARDVLDVCRDLAAQGVFCYRIRPGQRLAPADTERR